MINIDKPKPQTNKAWIPFKPNNTILFALYIYGIHKDINI